MLPCPGRCSVLALPLGPPTLILLLPCPGHILSFRSVTGRTTGWAQAHFFVGPVGEVSGRLTGLGRGVSACSWKKFAKPPRELHARKGWKLLMSSGKSANNAS